MKQFLYIGELRDIKDRDLGINDKKIGITSSLDIREFQLSQTKSPIIFKIIKSWEFEDKVKEVEKILHERFKDYRIIGEWFDDKENNLLDEIYNFLKYLSRLGINYNEININDNESIKPKRIKGSDKTIIKVNNTTFNGKSLGDLYLQVLKYLIESNYSKRIDNILPYSTSSVRYFISKTPYHQRGNDFHSSVEYKGYYMESHKDYKNGLKSLKDFLLELNIRMDIIRCDYEHY
tara:strand:+ start:177 stop:878 length:702 start_codon:yes stop_codon:yes gene_type:complete